MSKKKINFAENYLSVQKEISDVKDALFSELEKQIKSMTIPNIVDAINNGLCQDYVLKLQNYLLENPFGLCSSLPNEISDAIREYKKKQ